MDGKQVIAASEMALKVAAAVAARDPQTVIVARTDSLQVNGVDDAIERCNLYADAGADLVFVDAPRSVEQLTEIAGRVDAPLLVNMAETGRTPPMTAAELERLGYRVVIFPATQTWMIAAAYQELCAEVVARGTTEGLRGRMLGFDDVNSLLDLARWQS
jgi:2-methylisocitrate lyase-like PEP mutase family enzyme